MAVVPSLAALEWRPVLAALGERDVARAACDQWLRSTPLDDVGPAAFAVLPAVSRNLDRLGIEHPDADRLRGIYRFSWTQCQLTLRDLGEAAGALAAEGLRVVAHRGAPIAARYLGDAGAIVTDQVDLLIDPADLDRAAAILARLGWRPAAPLPPASVRATFGRLAFERASRRRVAIHWRSFPAGSPRASDAGILARAAPFAVNGVELLLAEPTDQLLLSCVRVSSLEEGEATRWTVECLGILMDAIDWSAFAARATAAGTLDLCAAVLGSLRPFAERLASLELPALPAVDPVPSFARTGPRPASGSRLERVVRALRRTAERYADACEWDARRRTPLGFLRFTTDFYAYEWRVRARDLPGTALRRWREGTAARRPAPQ